MEKLRIGIIGYGGIGEKHAASITTGKVPRMELAAVCARSPARQAVFREEHPGIPVFDTAEALYRSGLCDAVLLATPHYDHPPQAIEAFSHGLHVLTEKPSGVSVKDVKALNEVAARSGRVFGIMYNQRTDPVYQALRSMLRSGELGPLKRITWIVTDWYRSQAYHDSSTWHSTWAGDGGGVLLNQSIHQLDLWQWLFGMPDRIWARAGFGKYHRIEVEDDVMAYFEYDSGVTGEYITSTGEAPGTNRLEIACDMGKLVAENGRLRFWRNEVPERVFNDTNTIPFGKPEYREEDVPVGPSAGAGHPGILNNFADAVLDGAPLLARGEDGILALTISNAILLSAWTGDMVDVAEFPADRFDSLLKEKIRQSAASK